MSAPEDTPQKRASVWVLLVVMCVGLLLSGYLGWLGAQWLGSDGDEAPIVFIPLLLAATFTFVLTVVVPAALLVKRRESRA